jgi:2-hydroxy-6-oxonona-2,4-dienedioate hydrolase
LRIAFADIAGIRTRYLYEGRGPALVMVQPIGHSADVFFRNIDELARHFTVIVPDLPGHGFSDAIDFADESPQSVTIRHFGRFIDFLGLDHYSVLGSSYGGLVAALLWFDRPNRVDNLVLVGTGSVFHPPAEQGAVLNAVRANATSAMADPSLESCRKRIQNICFSPTSAAEEILLVQLSYYALPDRLSAYVATIEGLVASAQSEASQVYHRLERLAARTLIITGREDSRAKWQLHEEGCCRFPDAKLEIFEECGHLPYMEHPQRFNSLVTDFLLDSPKGPP